MPRFDYPSADAVLGKALSAGISGGGVYDLVVALSAGRADATLLSLDRRATSTYETARIQFELLT